jgi:hypothetical protein
MIRNDLHNRLAYATALPPVAATGNAPLVSAIIDTAGYLAIEFLIIFGALATAGASFAVTMDHSDLLAFTDAVAVPPEEMLGTLAAAGFKGTDGGGTRKIGYLGIKQYVRLTITPTGNTGAAALGVGIVGQTCYSGFVG